MDKKAIVEEILETLRAEFGIRRDTSQRTRAAGNDAESRAEGKYDTRSTEDNYLADGLARQAHAAAQAAAAYENFDPQPFDAGARIDVGALVQLDMGGQPESFFLGPAGGGIEITIAGVPVTVLTPDSPLGRQLMGSRSGDATTAPRATVISVE